MNTEVFRFSRCREYFVPFYFKSMMKRSKYGYSKGTNCNKPLRLERRLYSNDAVDQPREKQKDKQKPPPGLRGKALGLWYRDRNREKAEKPIAISLNDSKIEEIEYIISVAHTLSSKGKNNTEDERFKQRFFRDRNVTLEEKLKDIDVTFMQHDVDLDKQLYEELMEKSSRNENYKKMLQFRRTLPSFKKKKEIVEAIDKNQVIVISGETGCGKTTQIVQYVLDNYIYNHKGSLYKAICTQPRRISAISVAERVSAERAEYIGISVGYVIRLQSEQPKREKGTITFVTTGILTQWLQSNPTLIGISHLFIDEIHERDTLSDFLLALLKYILPKRPDLKVILMSATLNSIKFSEYFGGVPFIEIPGFTYPVEEFYLEDILQKVNFKFYESSYVKKKCIDSTFRNYVIPYVNNLERENKISKSVATELRNPLSEDLNIDFISEVVYYICTHEPEGAILVFVPGLVQIQDLHRKLTGNRYFSSSRALIIPMHSIMPTVNQKKAFCTPPKGIRKIIISTTICEASITIDDVRYVVDSGKNKTQNFDLNKNVRTLEPEWETLANAKQRKGRSGRTQAGKCYKLFTKAREETFEPYPLPDIQRCRLEEVILNAKTLQLGSVEPFLEKLIDPPDPKGVKLSLKMLRTLNLIDSEERLTPLGYHVAKLPLDPQTGKMILMGALFSCLDPILSVAACLNFKDPFEFVLGKEDRVREKREEFSLSSKSDHFMLSNAVIGWELARNGKYDFQFARDNFLSHHNLQLISNMKKQFAGYLHNMNFAVSSDPKDRRSNINSGNVSLLKAIVCSGLYPNVAVIKTSNRNKPPKQLILKTIDHPRVQLHLKSSLVTIRDFESPFLVYFEKIKSSSIFLHDATMVYPMALLFFGEKCDIIRDNGYYIRVDDMIKFSCARRTAELVQKLRNELVWILEQAVLYPGVIDWEKEDQKTLILKSIVELITLEDKTSLEELGLEFEAE